VTSSDVRINANKTPKGSGINADDPAGASAGETSTTPRMISNDRLALMDQPALRKVEKRSASKEAPSISSTIDTPPISNTAENIVIVLMQKSYAG